MAVSKAGLIRLSSTQFPYKKWLVSRRGNSRNAKPNALAPESEIRFPNRYGSSLVKKVGNGEETNH